MAMEHPVLVIGAGLAGLSLARVLHHKNIPVQIFESTTREKTEGYGISLRSWAYSPLLTELGISEEELRKLAATDAATGGRGHIEGIMYDAVSGKTLMKAPASQTGSPAGDVFRANRNRLRHFLMQGLDVAFDHTLETLEINEEERFITARFANGVCVKGCMLVGADGVHSTGMTYSRGLNLHSDNTHSPQNPSPSDKTRRDPCFSVQRRATDPTLRI